MRPFVLFSVLCCVFTTAVIVLTRAEPHGCCPPASGSTYMVPFKLHSVEMMADGTVRCWLKHDGGNLLILTKDEFDALEVK